MYGRGWWVCWGGRIAGDVGGRAAVFGAGLGTVGGGGRMGAVVVGVGGNISRLTYRSLIRA
jgi:hypothetical protein